jgi:hypothetical protein
MLFVTYKIVCTYVTSLFNEPVSIWTMQQTDKMAHWEVQKHEDYRNKMVTKECRMETTPLILSYVWH